MNKMIVLAALLLVVTQCNFLRSHDYWYTAPKLPITKGIPFSDKLWNYCDFKCTYLENFVPKGSAYDDAVVVPFTESTFKPDFAACYFRNSKNPNSDYKIWNQVVQNNWFAANCGDGDDKEDYYNQTLGASPKYKVSGDILGQGLGT